MSNKLLKQAGEALTPVGVYLRSGKVFSHPEFYPQHNNGEFQVQYKTKPLSECKVLQGEDEGSKVVSFLFECGVRVVDESADEKSDDFVQAEITAVFAAEYQFNGTTVNEDVMSEFLKCNVRFHVWPFWREYLQSTCTRMGLPVIPLPHYFRPQESQNK
jgi:hypothetical protein